MDIKFNFHPFGRWLLTLFGSAGLFTFIISHRAVLHFQHVPFFPSNLRGNYWVFVSATLILYGSFILFSQILLRFLEKRLKKKFRISRDALNTLGLDSVRNGVFLSALFFIYGAALIYADRSLLNVWDILFFIIFVGFYYVGTYLHFYYSIPLDLWEADDPKVELEKLKIEYDEQRMYLRVFLWVIVSFLISQVFVILKTKFEPYLRNPEENLHLQPVMVVNALQISFLIISTWGMVLSRFLRRMEEVKFKMMKLNLRKGNSG
jgi:hypothetical protein